jgi:hypothetical protein
MRRTGLMLAYLSSSDKPSCSIETDLIKKNISILGITKQSFPRLIRVRISSGLRSEVKAFVVVSNLPGNGLLNGQVQTLEANRESG